VIRQQKSELREDAFPERHITHNFYYFSNFRL
jgi:hypothetical protein